MKHLFKGGPKALLFILSIVGVVGCGGTAAPPSLEEELEATKEWVIGVGRAAIVGSPTCPRIDPPGQFTVAGGRVTQCMRWTVQQWSDPNNTQVERNGRLKCDFCTGPGIVNQMDGSTHRLFTADIPRGYSLYYAIDPATVPAGRQLNFGVVWITSSGITSSSHTLTAANGYNALVAPPSGTGNWSAIILPVRSDFIPPASPVTYRHRIQLQVQ